MRKPILHNYTASVHVVCKVVTKRISVQEWDIAERYNDFILLKLSQSRGPCCRIEQIAS